MLRSALVRWSTTASGTASPALAGLACLESGTPSWGWTHEDGRVELRTAGARGASVTSLAVSLALAIRRARLDVGGRVLVVGEGFAARLAAAVAQQAGGRVAVSPRGGAEAGAGAPPDAVIEATGDGSGLPGALAACGSWGAVLALEPAGASAGCDWYPDLHRRALTFLSFGPRPRIEAADEPVVRRGLEGLAAILPGLAPEAGTVQPVLDQNGRPVGRLSREPSGPWGELVVEAR